MGSALEEVAKAADEVSDEQRHIAQRARSLEEKRASGWSWSSLLDTAEGRGFGDLLRRSARRATGAASKFTAALAHELSVEGESRRRIAGRLGVTHQRVSAILKGRDNGSNGSSNGSDD